MQKIRSTPKDAIIDVGCGTSTFVDALIDLGYKNITLLDISSTALEITKKRLGKKAAIPLYRAEDICCFSLKQQFDIWHDRAVFHFLQKEEEQQDYFANLHKSLSLKGHAIIGTFGLNGPDSCTTLPVRQYNEERMIHLTQNHFKILEVIDEIHIAPSGGKQHYCFFILKPKQ